MFFGKWFCLFDIRFVDDLDFSNFYGILWFYDTLLLPSEPAMCALLSRCNVVISKSFWRWHSIFTLLRRSNAIIIHRRFFVTECIWSCTCKVMFNQALHCTICWNALIDIDRFVPYFLRTVDLRTILLKIICVSHECHTMWWCVCVIPWVFFNSSNVNS